MVTKKKYTRRTWTWKFVKIIARFLAGILFLMIIMFAIGEGLPDPLELKTGELITFISFVIMLSGLAACFKWEGIGGFVILGGYILFAAINSASITFGVMSLFPLTAILFLACWWEEQKKTR
jgi:hypothetical protein